MTVDQSKFDDFTTLIHSANLSVRATNVILKNCSSLRELISLDEDHLYSWPNCGHKTVREIIRFIENIRGSIDIPVPYSTGEEKLHDPPTELSLKLLPLFSSKKLDNITKDDLHIGFHGSTEISDLLLSLRTTKVLYRLELKTVGDVLLTPASFLLNQRNFGRKSLDELQMAICSLIIPGSVHTINAETGFEIDYSSYQAMILSLLQVCEKKERNRRLLQARLCFNDGKAPTLQELGNLFGITRERARQILKKGWDKISSKIVLNKLDFFWQTIYKVVSQGGGIIHLKALPSLLQSEFNWPSAPYFLALGQLLSLKFPDRSFKKEDDLVQVDCECENCQVPLQQLRSLDFNNNESFHVEVVSMQLANYCHQNCPWKLLLKKFHRAYVEHRLNECNSLLLHNELILPREIWKEKYCNNLEDVICHILEKHGKPMHFKEIAEIVRTTNLNFSNTSEHNIHSAILRYTDNIEITSRGMYGLKKWGLGGYRSVSTAIEELIDSHGLPMRANDIIKKLEGEFSRQNITAALSNWKNRFCSIGDGFYDLTSTWPKRNLQELIRMLPENVARFASYLISHNNTSYKLVMAFIFIRSMDEEGTICLSKLKSMFYNFYHSRYKKGLVIEQKSALMSRIGELSENEIKHKASSKPLISFFESDFIKISLDKKKLKLTDSISRYLHNSYIKNCLLIILLKALDEYYLKITPAEATKNVHNFENEPSTLLSKSRSSNKPLPESDRSESISSLSIKKKRKKKIRL